MVVTIIRKQIKINFFVDYDPKKKKNENHIIVQGVMNLQYKQFNVRKVKQGA